MRTTPVAVQEIVTFRELSVRPAGRKAATCQLTALLGRAEECATYTARHSLRDIPLQRSVRPVISNGRYLEIVAAPASACDRVPLRTTIGLGRGQRHPAEIAPQST